MTPAIELCDIYKTFKLRSWRTFLLQKPARRVEVLRGASFTVNHGEIVSLLGLNGAGKTTFIKILASLIIPDRGKARINGFDTSLEDQKTRPLIGLVNTNPRSFYWRLTGRQNLTFFASLYNLSSDERTRRVNHLLDWLGLGDKADIAFMKYSSGQQQLLGICRAMLGDPEIMLMDEPTNSLDPLASARLRNFVKHELASRRNKAILWCTHLLQEAEQVSDRIAILHKGKIITQDTLQTIKKRIEKEKHYLIKIKSTNDTLPDRLQPIVISSRKTGNALEVEIKSEEADIPLILNQLVQAGIQVFMVKPVETALEQVFEKLTSATPHS